MVLGVKSPTIGIEVLDVRGSSVVIIIGSIISYVLSCFSTFVKHHCVTLWLDRKKMCH